MLIVVEYRNIQCLLQPLFDLKAAGRADVLQIDAAESGSDPGDGFDDLLRILRVQADGDRVHPAKLLEENSLSFHDRHGGMGADVAQAQNRGTVGDHRDGVRLHRIGIGGFPVLCDYLAGLCHARCIGQCQILSGPDRHLGNSFQFSVQLFMKRKRFFVCRHLILHSVLSDR